MFFPSQEQYLKMSEEYNLIPIYTEVMVDLDTPISIYRKAGMGKQGFLLESVEGGEKLARFSFIGLEPMASLTGRRGTVQIANGGKQQIIVGPPLAVLKKLMQSFKTPDLTGMPRFFGGAVGYFGYDMIRDFELLPDISADDLKLPDCRFMFPRYVLVFDHVQHRMKIIINSEPGDNPAEAYEEAIKNLQNIKRLVAKAGPSPDSAEQPKAIISNIHSNITKEQFCSMVDRAKDYIRAGDIFQVVLSQRFCTKLETDPFDLYRTLRQVNPAPYLYYLDFGDSQIIGSSPEMLVRVENGVVETCPIAGTRPRGVTPEEDLRLERELLADEKEKSEHLMLVDLGRNDLGRVCKCGTIEISDFMEIQKYSHVMHMVSLLRGHLGENCTGYDALQACFPAGTLTGAPKIRAMEIIEELEPVKRGVYGGAIGYLGYNGNIDTCITIRTILVHGGNAYVQAGAGIVADSDPEREYQETITKARALLETLRFREVV